MPAKGRDQPDPPFPENPPGRVGCERRFKIPHIGGKGEKAMQKSEFIAKLIGPVLIAIALGMLFNTATFRGLGEEFLRSNAMIYLSGLLTMALGLTLVNVHNMWNRGWRLIITVLGWLMVIGGALRIMLPRQIELIGGTAFAEPATVTICGLIALLLGLILTYYGYGGPALVARLQPSPARRAPARASKAKRRRRR
jgi:hypothetical protein